MKKILIILSCLILSVSCVIKDQDDDSSDDFDVEGSCRLLNGSASVINCIEFNGSLSDLQMDSACDDFATDYAPEGATVTSLDTSGVILGCGSSDRVGYCIKQNHVIHYYDTDSAWGRGSAQSDCTAKSGVFR